MAHAAHADHADHEHHGPPKGFIQRWVMTTNHKDIGTLYMVFAGLMFFIGGAMALVIRAEPRRLEARLYHFGPEARRFEAEWLTLAPGEYRLEVRPLDEGEGGVQELRLRVSAKERRTVIHLPSRRECQLIVHALP